MPKNRHWDWWVGGLLLGVFFLLELSIGSVPISFDQLIQLVFGGSPAVTEAVSNIFYKIRLPRAITAILAGVSISTAGLLMQTLFRNPLAGPSVLGITAGATLGVSVVTLSGGFISTSILLMQVGWGKSSLLILASILGATAILLLLVAISPFIKDNLILLLIGIMIGQLTIAMVSIFQYVSSPQEIQTYILWTLGSLSGASRSQVILMALTSFILISLTYTMATKLNIWQQGESFAQSVGLSPVKTRLIVIMLAGGLTGTITAFCGPIGFIGIAVPFLARVWRKTDDHRQVIPATILLGGLVMLICDLMAQLPGRQEVLPLNAVTACIGAPIVIILIVRNRRLRHTF
ncbi:MAG: iron ABC transporter permease [Bacteroidota bacterium]